MAIDERALQAGLEAYRAEACWPIAPANHKDALRAFALAYEAAKPAPSPAEVSEGVAVKPLEWNPYRAETPFGYYHIDDQTDRSASELDGRPPFLLSGSRIDLSRHPTLETARAAAQADYESRIRAALTASPAPAEADLLKKLLHEEQRHVALALREAGEQRVRADRAEEELRNQLGLTKFGLWHRMHNAQTGAETGERCGCIVAKPYDATNTDAQCPICEGVASPVEPKAVAPAGVVARYEYRMRPTWKTDQPWSPWAECTEGHARLVASRPVIDDWESEARALHAVALATAPSAAAPAPEAGEEK